ncbi:MAG: glutamate formimidoyltransferase [Chloroflexi bacterium]|jgi:glutamate formiminotransferase/formiminotetrahydrofolate cyclodeaminase|nr:glutamate formimidoyltransferase [Chloroflexota bacterium]HOE35805.1 glutamate formimidoyltransferase [Anaerolineaceae bacterium]HQK42923.1 glutamate formimidoyltransferase [Anaerolineaceae bacterium]
MPLKIVECIPNFSEARRPEVVDQIAAAIQSVAGVGVLDRHSDLDHNRTVLTFVGEPAAVEEAAYAAIAKAAQLIDLEQHEGQHPRIGATDVVPFVPISGVTMVECVEMARRLGKRVADELAIPVYFYEEAALRPDRRNLEDIRRGEYEGLKLAIQQDPSRAPDLGPARLGSAGATVIGAREALIAYNIYLNTSDVGIAEKIARRVRNSSGGFRYVKAMGVLVGGLAQVSMNLTNFRRSPMAQITEMVRREAARYGAGIHHSEIVGLVPNQALVNAARWYLQLDGFENEQLLDSRLFAWQGEQMSAAKTEQSDFLEQVAEGTPSPGGGSAAAHTGALAAALAAMVGRLTVGKPKYAEVEAETWQIIARAEALRKELTEAIDLDAQAFDGILQARRLPKLTESQQQARSEAITKATLHAARVPLETAGKCLAVMKLAARMAEIGNLNAISDAGAGAQLAAAAFRSAALNVRINLLGMENEPEPARILAELDNLQGEAEGVLSSVQESLAKRAGLRA